MKISKYTDFFHDGYVNDVVHSGRNISFLLESSVIEDVNLIPDKKFLSNANTFKGRLNLYNIKSFYIGGQKYKDIFQMEYDDGDILDFQIEGNKVLLLIEWRNFPPKVRNTDVSKIEIEAEKIEWIPEAV